MADDGKLVFPSCIPGRVEENGLRGDRGVA
jgi:hypothetical protein